MKLRFLVIALVILVSAGALQAQTPRPAPGVPPFMGNWNPPAALSTDWWNNSETANELRLTDAQKSNSNR